MPSVAAIAGDTKQWDVMAWAIRQGVWLPGPSHQAVLLYLCANAFYREDNSEGARPGQVMFSASRYEDIMAGTAIRTHDTVRRVLNDLQDRAYVARHVRPGGGHQPLLIRVLWDQSMDEYRERLRAGEADLLPGLRRGRTVSGNRADVVPLRLLADPEYAGSPDPSESSGLTPDISVV